MEGCHQNRTKLGFVLALLLLAAMVGVGGCIEAKGNVPSSYAARLGKEVLPEVILLTPETPEFADPYVTIMKDFVMISGTAPHYLKFQSIDAIRTGGPYELVPNDFRYNDGTPLEGPGWDAKPSLWASSTEPRLWAPGDAGDPTVIWYSGHMRPRAGALTAAWPDDNFSRDVFAFLEKSPGIWFSQLDSVFSATTTGTGTWPRAIGNYLGHRYGHQIVGAPTSKNGATLIPHIFYEAVTEIKKDGSPLTTKIFMDEMATPLQNRGKPVELVSPINPKTGKPYPSTLREDGSSLVEGPLYFRFAVDGEDWEAIGFSAGSYYARYPAAFASRRVADGLLGKPFQLDLTDDGLDLHDAGTSIGSALELTGGPGRPAVIVRQDGAAIPDSKGRLSVLFHAYRRANPSFRAVYYAPLQIQKTPKGTLRFDIATDRNANSPLR